MSEARITDEELADRVMSYGARVSQSLSLFAEQLISLGGIFCDEFEPPEQDGAERRAEVLTILHRFGEVHEMKKDAEALCDALGEQAERCRARDGTVAEFLANDDEREELEELLAFLRARLPGGEDGDDVDGCGTCVELLALCASHEDEWRVFVSEGEALLQGADGFEGNAPSTRETQ